MTDMEFKSLSNVRKALEKDVVEIADRTGNKILYEGAKKAFQNNLAAKDLSEHFAKALDVTQNVKPRDLLNQLKKFRTLAADQGGTYHLLSPQMKDVARGLEYTGEKILNGYVRPTAGISLGQLAVGSALGGGAYAASQSETVSLPQQAAVMTTVVGVSLLLQSKTGISLLTKVGKSGPGSHALKEVLQTAVRIGAAASAISKSPGEARPASIDDYKKLSSKEIRALLEEERKSQMEDN